MNGYIIGGILPIALGMSAMVYGQHAKSKVDSSEVSQVVQNKVDEVLKRIDEVRGAKRIKRPLVRSTKSSKNSKPGQSGFLRIANEKKSNLQELISIQSMSS